MKRLLKAKSVARGNSTYFNALDWNVSMQDIQDDSTEMASVLAFLRKESKLRRRK